MEGSDIDFSHATKFVEAVANKVYYGPVYFRDNSEPYITLALAGIRRGAGVSVAEVNLKLVWDFVMQMKVGEHGLAYIVDAEGRVVVHPDSSFQSDFSGLAQVQAVLPGSRAQRVEVAHDIRGREVLTADASVGQPDWFVFVEQASDELMRSMHRQSGGEMRRREFIAGLSGAAAWQSLLLRADEVIE
jgi:two-component system, NtrC family, sensor kinase